MEIFKLLGSDTFMLTPDDGSHYQLVSGEFLRTIGTIKRKSRYRCFIALGHAVSSIWEVEGPGGVK
jgi:hypothetical protein